MAHSAAQEGVYIPGCIGAPGAANRRWSERDADYLRHFGHMGAYYMAFDLGRSEAAVRNFASRHGIKLGGTLGRADPEPAP